MGIGFDDDTPAASAPFPAARRPVSRSAAILTFFTLALHALNLGVQLLIARLFGAAEAVDALFAALAVPQYASLLLLGSIPAVFIPVARGHAGQPDRRGRLLGGALSLVVMSLGGIASAGIVFAAPLVGALAPGLGPAPHQLAVAMVRMLFPAIVAMGATILLTAQCHVDDDFSRPALAAVAGAATNLVVLFALHRYFGVKAAAIGFTAGALVNLALLAGTRLPGYVRFGDRAWADPGVGEMLRLIWPLLLSGLVARAGILIDRFVASGLPAGSISRLTYAYRIMTLAGYLLSAGLATAVFPRMADHAAAEDVPAMQRTFARYVRLLWVAVAPVALAGMALSPALVAALFEGRRFTPADTAAVASLLRIYLLALPATCLGILLAGALYSMRATKVVAVLGAAEVALYVPCALLLTSQLGVAGLAWTVVLTMSLAVTALFVAVRRGLRVTDPAPIWRPVLRTVAAAATAGAAAFLVASMLANPWAILAAGLTASAAAYTGALGLLNPEDGRILTAAALRLLRRPATATGD